MAEDTKDTKDAKSKGPGRGGVRIGTVAAAILITAVAALAVVIVIAGGGDPAGPEADATATPTGPAESGSADGDGAGEALTAAPEGIAWEVDAGLVLPVSDEHGPAEVTGEGVPTGFAHTPEGALVATVQILGRSEPPFDAASRRAVITAAFEAGPDRDALLAAVDDAATAPAPADIAVVAGFAMHAYNADAAVVELVMDAGDARYISFMTDLVWDEGAGTWLVVPPAGGDWSIAVRELENLDGVIVWGP